MYLGIDYMIATIRFYCASFFLICALCADEALLFDSSSSMHSSWDLVGKTTVVDLKQSQSAEIVFKSEGKPPYAFPIPLTFTLKKVQIEIDADGQKLIQDTKNPGQILSLTELSHFVDRPFSLKLTQTAPFVAYEDAFAKQFADLQSFDQPVFEGLFIDALHQYMEILQHPLKVGEGFQLTWPRSTRQAFTAVATYAVKEVTEEQAVIESTWVVERQKSLLKGSKGEDVPAVIIGEMKGRWTIQRRDLLQFHFEEKGTISYSIGFEDDQASIRHDVERTASMKRPSVPNH